MPLSIYSHIFNPFAVLAQQNRPSKTFNKAICHYSKLLVLKTVETKNLSEFYPDFLKI